MLIVLSPAKSLDYESPLKIKKHTLPDFVGESAKLIADLKKLSPQQVGKLMGISDPLAVLNAGRYRDWSKICTTENSRPALLAFNGDVYEGFDARSLDAKALDFAQEHVRILSGLYGVLRPLDLMQPYRLEMGTALKNARGKDLYAFWGDRLGKALNKELAAHKTKALVNLASEEYFKAVQGFDAPVITPVFQERKGGAWKVVSFNAKRARGLMARFVIEHKIDDPKKLVAFDSEGYAFDAKASTPDTL
ncbi:MAG: peroxide stress protein YaaA, partial [Polynucleobacter sp.]